MCPLILQTLGRALFIDVLAYTGWSDGCGPTIAFGIDMHLCQLILGV